MNFLLDHAGVGIILTSIGALGKYVQTYLKANNAIIESLRTEVARQKTVIEDQTKEMHTLKNRITELSLRVQMYERQTTTITVSPDMDDPTGKPPVTTIATKQN
jgi:phage-related tail protein